jgi:sarcosine oxidase
VNQHFAIIGRGLIGSAAARHLAMLGHEVTLIGPSEPFDKLTHQGVFASHYDEGRITRVMDPDPFWSRVSAASIARYSEIEAQSGVEFFNPVGALVGGQEGSPYVDGLRAVAAQNPAASIEMNAKMAAIKFPYLDLGDNAVVFHEAQNAGHISPRNLVNAQTIAAERAGAEVIDATALKIGDGAVHTDAGIIEADQILVAAGGFTNGLLEAPIDMSVYARTVAFFEIGSIEALRLFAMPSLVYRQHADEGPYVLPPIRYPDGKTFLKIGGEAVDVLLETQEDIADWFRSGGNNDVAEQLEDELLALLPDIEIEARTHTACVTSFTPNDLPFIGRIAPNLSVATAGCGRGAKCSDELGRLGAMVALGHGDDGLELVL